jgi:NAD(P)-dependent dehydrogenase (short-subunit alcohol dehydrogenase family)
MPKNQALAIVLTGASRGLGLAMTSGFIQRGHTVHGCARTPRAVAGLRERFADGGHTFEAVDVRDSEAVETWAQRVLAADGPPDLLLNNAALVNRNAVLWKVPPEEFSEVIDANIKGVANVIHAFVPAMVRRKRGVIVNFSSGWGRSVSAEVAPYCATKWAIEGLTKALAEELPEGMAAVPLNPGVINTDMLRSCFGREAANYPTPQQWAETAVPLLLRLGPQDNGKSLSVR